MEVQFEEFGQWSTSAYSARNPKSPEVFSAGSNPKCTRIGTHDYLQVQQLHFCTTRFQVVLIIAIFLDADDKGRDQQISAHEVRWEM